MTKQIQTTYLQPKFRETGYSLGAHEWPEKLSRNNVEQRALWDCSSRRCARDSHKQKKRKEKEKKSCSILDGALLIYLYIFERHQLRCQVPVSESLWIMSFPVSLHCLYIVESNHSSGSLRGIFCYVPFLHTFKVQHFFCHAHDG